MKGGRGKVAVRSRQRGVLAQQTYRLRYCRESVARVPYLANGRHIHSLRPASRQTQQLVLHNTAERWYILYRRWSCRYSIRLVEDSLLHCTLSSKGKGKGKIHPRTGDENPEGD
jgi:hypothetical protein